MRPLKQGSKGLVAVLEVDGYDIFDIKCAITELRPQILWCNCL